MAVILPRFTGMAYAAFVPGLPFRVDPHSPAVGNKEGIIMVEKVFSLSQTERIQKVLFDERMHYLHMRLAQGEGLPEHNANSNVYMTVLRGVLSIRLDHQEPHEYGPGTVLVIPVHTLMNVTNQRADLLELTVVKVPAPEA